MMTEIGWEWRSAVAPHDLGALVPAAVGVMLVACMASATHEDVAAVSIAPLIDRSRFASTAPDGWAMGAGWEFSSTGAAAVSSAVATWDRALPANCVLEMVFDLPARRPDEKVDDKDPKPLGIAAFSVSNATDGGDQISVTGRYLPQKYEATIAGPGADGKMTNVQISGDSRPSVLLAWEEAKAHPGWAGQTISLGVAFGGDTSRLLVNGSEVGRIATSSHSRRQVSVSAERITLREVRVLPGIEPRFTVLTGLGMALGNGGRSDHSLARKDTWYALIAGGLAPAGRGSALIHLGRVPMVVHGSGEGRLAAIDVSAERHRSAAWSEGKGVLTTPVAPSDAARYGFANLLLFQPAGRSGKTPALGFGLRVPEWASGELKNVYVGQTPVRYADEGVTVRPVRELGDGWFHARVPLNPAAQQRAGKHVYLARPWVIEGGIPVPGGRPSALHVAAVTLERAAIDLAITGNGLGNVYCEPDEPRLTATVRNLTDEAVIVQRGKGDGSLFGGRRPAELGNKQIGLSIPFCGEVREVEW